MIFTIFSIYRSREKIDLRLGLEDLYGWRLQKLPESRYLILSRHIPINVLLYVNTVRNFSRVSFVKEFNVEVTLRLTITVKWIYLDCKYNCHKKCEQFVPKDCHGNAPQTLSGLLGTEDDSEFFTTYISTCIHLCISIYIHLSIYLLIYLLEIVR